MTRDEAIEGLKSLVEVRRKYGDMQTWKDEIECLDMAIKALEQEPVLDKIRSEIEQLPTNYIEVQRPHSTVERDVVEIDAVLRVLDKYKTESEE